MIAEGRNQSIRLKEKLDGQEEKVCPVLSALKTGGKLPQGVAKAARGKVIAGHGPQGSDRTDSVPIRGNTELCEADPNQKCELETPALN